MSQNSIRLSLTVVILCLSGCGGCGGPINGPSPGGGDSVEFALSSLEGGAIDARAEIPWKVSHALAKISNLSYEDEIAVKAQMKDWGFAETTVIHLGSHFVSISSTSKVIVVAFRGTDDKFDWLSNAQILPKNLPDGALHTGFFNTFAGLFVFLTPELQRHDAADKKLWITGHSLGGALSVVHGYATSIQTQTNLQGIVTFGQPAIVDPSMDRFLTEKLEGRYVRYVNEQDLVTRVPPNLRHFGTIVWFNGDEVQWSGRQAVAAKSDEQPLGPEMLSPEEFELVRHDLQDITDATPTDEPAPRVMASGFFQSLEDHKMAHYIKKIGDNVPDGE